MNPKQNYEINKNSVEKSLEPNEIKKIKFSEIKTEVKNPGSFNYHEAIVAYLDILGFSGKKDLEDIERTLFDFSSPLAIASKKIPDIKFYIFSDCAFIIAQVKFLREILEIIRFAFSQWISDGILVRGGIAKGSFGEMFTWLHPNAKHDFGSNFISSLFSGTAVVEAVRLEENGDAALLFCSKELAKIVQLESGEIVYEIDDNKFVIPWTYDTKFLIGIISIASRRLVKFLSSEKEVYSTIINKLKNTIIFSINLSEKPILLISIILTILKIPDTPEFVRNSLCKILLINDIDEYEQLIQEWKKTDYYEIVKFIADSDSSLP